MTLTPTEVALIHLCRCRNDLRARTEVEPSEFNKGFTAGLSQALSILRVIGELPVESANYLAGIPNEIAEDAIAHLSDIG